MLTIELEGRKSITSFDLETAPTTAFVRYSGELYHIEEAGGLRWEETTDVPPPSASVTVIAIDGTMTVELPPTPAVTPTELIPEAQDDASPDHAATV